MIGDKDFMNVVEFKRFDFEVYKVWGEVLLGGWKWRLVESIFEFFNYLFKCYVEC